MKLWSYILCVVFFFTSVPGIAAETAHSHDAKIKTDKASVNIWKLPTVLPPKILRIKDGGSATITAGFVRERIGNKWVRRLAYNRMIPGPILSATQNANIRVTLINKTGAPTTCPFSYSGPLTETAHLGNVAFRSGKKIEWDAANLKIPNAPAAEAFLGRDYRPGWSLG